MLGREKNKRRITRLVILRCIKNKKDYYYCLHVSRCYCCCFCCNGAVEYSERVRGGVNWELGIKKRLGRSRRGAEEEAKRNRNKGMIV